MGLMTRAQILGAQDIGFETVDLSDVPGWGEVRIRDLSAAERDRLEASLVEERKQVGKGGKVQVSRSMRMENVRARFCAACMCDEHGATIFSAADVELLGQKSARALNRIFGRIQERNALTDEDVEGLAEDFLPDPNDVLPSD